MAKQEKPRLMKDGLNRAAIERIGRNLERASLDFDATAFTKRVMNGLDDLELKERVVHTTKILRDALPEDYLEALEVLLRASEVWDSGQEGDALRGFAAWPVLEFISMYGLEHFQRSMQGLRRMTRLFTAEFAIRPFVIQAQEEVFALLHEWVKDPDPNVRRLVSEGIRPRLPWAPRLPALQKDPSPILPLLDALKDDPSLFVRRSVANNLNDIAKDNPDLVIETCKSWLENATAERLWIIRHATRTLIKEAHPGIWSLMGYTEKPQVEVTSLVLGADVVQIGEQLDFSCTLTSNADEVQSFVLDYAVHHVKANGKTRAKVFKLKNIKLKAGASIELHKKHSFRKITTRKYYSGIHTIELLVNGKSVAKQDFTLEVS